MVVVEKVILELLVMIGAASYPSVFLLELIGWISRPVLGDISILAGF